MGRNSRETVQRHRRYFDTEAADFDAIEKDPRLVKDPIRRFVYRFIFRDHIHNERLAATLGMARSFRDDWRGSRVLEIGGGHGLYSIQFAAMGAWVVMVDYSEAMMAIARQNVAEARMERSVRLICADAQTLALRGSFDMVFLTGVTDYLPKSTLGALGRQLQGFTPQLVIITFPTYSLFSAARWIWLTLAKRLRLSFFTRQEMQRFAATNGFRISQRRRIPGYDVLALTIDP